MDKLAILLLVVAAICTLITVITEFTKEVGILKKIPTSFQVLLTSIIICEICLFVALSYFDIRLLWYYPVAVLFVAFIIAFICTRGWDYLLEIFKRFYRGGGGEKKGGDGK